MRVGVIGTNWGGLLVHAFAQAGSPVVALCGQDERKTRELAARSGIALATTSPEVLCEACDLVVVASNDAAHYAHARLALEQFGRHVLCEKPLATSTDDALELECVARRRPDCLSIVNFPFRHIEAFRRLQAKLARLGPTRQVTIEWYSSTIPRFAGERGVDLLRSADFGGVSHAIDLALWLSGAVPFWIQGVTYGNPAHTLNFTLGTEHGLTCIGFRPSVITGTWCRGRLCGDDWEASFATTHTPDMGSEAERPAPWSERYPPWSFRFREPIRIWRRGTAEREREETIDGDERSDPWLSALARIAAQVLALDRSPDSQMASFRDGAIVQSILGTLRGTPDEAGVYVVAKTDLRLPSPS